MVDIPDDPMKRKIDSMTQREMAAAWRFAPMGDPMFQRPTFDYFKERFESLGGMTPEISKELGW